MAQTNPFELIKNQAENDAALLPGQQPATASPAQRFEPIDVDTDATTTAAPVAHASSASRAAPTRADVIKRAVANGVDPALVLSIWSQESGGNWKSRDSNKGARGGMQVMPDTFRAMMGDADQRDPWNNLEAGIKYIAYGQKTLGTTDPELLAAGYHAGYDRDSLKRGIIPNVSDGAKNTRDYAREVAGRAGKTVSDSGEASRFAPMSDDEVKQYQATGAADPSRYAPISDDELLKLSAPAEATK